MPRVESLTLGAPCWVELYTSEPERAADFYGRLFGWMPQETGEEFGAYVNFVKNGQRMAGCMKNDGASGAPDSWSVYLAVDNCEVVAETAANHGGQLIIPPTQVGELGTAAVISDSNQAVVGLWQPGTHRGFTVIGEPGAPAWFELHARDYEGAVQFYRDVFGWDTHVMGDTDEFRYTTLGEGDDAEAGIMDASGLLAEDISPYWSVYFYVDDTDTAVHRAQENGGTVLEPAADTPYGRVAEFADPTGAVFRVVHQP